MPNLRDHTPMLSKWTQLTNRSLSPVMRVFLDEVHTAWDHAWDEGVTPLDGLAQEVFPGIWVGCERAVHDEETIKKGNITSILNMGVEIDYEPWGDMFVAKVGIDDGVVAAAGAFEKAALEIHLARKQDKNILVHCAAGISRSATAVIAYLMLYHDMGFLGALNMIRKGRPQINPHPHLVRSLIRDLGDRFKK